MIGQKEIGTVAAHGASEEKTSKPSRGLFRETLTWSQPPRSVEELQALANQILCYQTIVSTAGGIVAIKRGMESFGMFRGKAEAYVADHGDDRYTITLGEEVFKESKEGLWWAQERARDTFTPYRGQSMTALQVVTAFYLNTLWEGIRSEEIIDKIPWATAVFDLDEGDVFETQCLNRARTARGARYLTVDQRNAVMVQWAVPQQYQEKLHAWLIENGIMVNDLTDPGFLANMKRFVDACERLGPAKMEHFVAKLGSQESQSDAFEKVLANMRVFASMKIGPLAGLIDGLTTFVGKALSAIGQTVKFLATHQGLALSVVLAGLYFFKTRYRKWVYENMGIVITGVVAYLLGWDSDRVAEENKTQDFVRKYLLQFFSQSIWQWYNRYISTEVTPETESAEFEIQAKREQRRARVGLVGLMLGVCAPVLPADKMEILRELAEGLTTTLEISEDLLSTFAKYLPEVVLKFFTQTGLLNLAVIDDPEVKKLAETAAGLAESLDRDRALLRTPAHLNTYFAVVRGLNKQIEKMETWSSDATPARGVLLDLRTRLQLYRDMANNLKDQAPRVPPVAVYLEGEPGIGKSWLLEKMARDMFPDTPFESLIYNRNCAEKFYSKYAGQDVMLMDDLFCNQNFGPDDNVQLADLLRMLSKSPMLLPMASVAEKGMQFESKVVLASSNRPFNEPVPLQRPYAFCRRFEGVKAVLRDKLEVEMKHGTVTYQFKNEETGEFNPDELVRALKDKVGGKVPHLKLHRWIYKGVKHTARNHYVLGPEVTYDEILNVVKARVVSEQGRARAQLQADKGETFDVQMFTLGRAVSRWWNKPSAEEIARHESKHSEVPSSSGVGWQVPPRDRIYVQGSDDDTTADGFGWTQDFSSEEDGGECDTKSDCGSEKSFQPPKKGKKWRWTAPDGTVRVTSSDEQFELEDELMPQLDEMSNKEAEQALGEQPTSICKTEASFKEMVVDKTSRLSVKTILKVVAALSVATLAAGAIYNHFRPRKPKKEAVVEEDVKLEESDEEETRPQSAWGTKKQLARSTKKGRKYMKVDEAKEEDSMQTQMLVVDPADQRLVQGPMRQVQDAFTKMRKNVVTVRRTSHRVFGLSPGGNKLWVPRHFLLNSGDRIPEDTVIEINRYDGSSVQMSFSWRSARCLQVGDQHLDFAELVLPEGIIFPKLGGLSPIGKAVPVGTLILAGLVRAPALSDEAVQLLPWVNFEASQYSYSSHGPTRDLTIPGMFTYEPTTDAGDCGAPLVGFTRDGTMHILGFHVGLRKRSYERCGVAIPLYSDMFETKMEIQGALDYKQTHADLGLPPSIKVVGELLVPRGLSAESKIVKTALYNHELTKKSTHGPALLRGSGQYSTHSLLCKAVTSIAPGEGSKTQPFPEEVAEPVMQHMEQRALLRRDYVQPRVLTLDEALNGWGNIKRLSMDKTPGIPLDSLRPPGEKGRAFLFDRDATGRLSIRSPELQAEIDALLNYEGGEPPFLAYCLGLKDELRRKEKITSPRLIMYSPVALTIVTRMYFGAYTETDRFEYDVPSCVGINVDSDDWDMRERRRRAKGRVYGMAADYGYFDSLSNSQVCEANKRVTDSYYGEVGSRAIRHMILENCMKANLVLGSYLLRKEVGGTTGNPLTVHWNNVMNEFFLRCAYQALYIEEEKQGREYMSPTTMDEEVDMSVYGDDNSSTMTAKVVGVFNFLSVREFFSKYGIVFTPSSKNEEDAVPYVSVDELDFLSRKTRIDLKKELGVTYLSVQKNQDFRSMAWKTRGLDDAMALSQNATCILYQSVGLGSKGFLQMRMKLLQALHDVGLGPHLPTWEDVSRNFRERKYNFTQDEARWTIFDEYNSFQNVPLAVPVLTIPSALPVMGQALDDLVIQSEEFVIQADSLTNDTIVAPEREPEDLAPAQHIAVPPTAKLTTVEDLLKRKQPFANYTTTERKLSWMADVWDTEPADSTRLVPAYFTYFGRVFRYWMGPLNLALYASTTTATDVTVSYTTVMDSGDVSNLFNAQLATVASTATYAGSMPIAVGQPVVIPMHVQVPAQHIGANNLFLVPTDQSEVDSAVPDLWGGSWCIGQTSNNMRSYVGVGDGFRFAFPHHIPYRNCMLEEEKKEPLPAPVPKFKPPQIKEKFVPQVKIWNVEDTFQEKDDFQTWKETNFQGEFFLPQGATTSALGKGIKAATGAYSNIKAVADRAVDVAGKVGDAVVNFDTPNQGSNAPPVEPRQGINMANMDGIQYAQVLGPMTGEPPMMDIPVGTTKPETRLQMLTMMTTLYETVEVNASMTAGEVLLRIPITCAPHLYLATDDLPFQPTMMEHVATAFTFWKGGINITMQCVGSQLANMRIGVASRIGSFGQPIPLSLFSSQYGRVFNFGEEDTLKFWVPFLSSQNWLRVPTPDSLGGGRGRPQDYCLGEIVVVVITPYQVNETMAQTMDINFFLEGNEDLEFKTPGENLARLGFEIPAEARKRAQQEEEDFELQMERTGAPGGEFNEDEKKELSVRPNGGPQREDTFNADGPAALWERMHVLAEVAWDAAALPGALLWSAPVPSGVIPLGPLNAVYNSFLYSKMTMTFTFSLSTSITSQGQVVAFFCPLAMNPGGYTLRDVLLLPHVLMKAGRTTAGIVQVPWIHPLNCLDIHSGETWRTRVGSVGIMVFNKFKIGAGASTQAPMINIGVQFHNMELSVPNPDAPAL